MHADARRKFREALERKNRNVKHGEEHKDATSRVHAGGPVAQKRAFRRKTG
jgi:hypothetical protein